MIEARGAEVGSERRRGRRGAAALAVALLALAAVSSPAQSVVRHAPLPGGGTFPGPAGAAWGRDSAAGTVQVVALNRDAAAAVARLAGSDRILCLHVSASDLTAAEFETLARERGQSIAALRVSSRQVPPDRIELLNLLPNLELLRYRAADFRIGDFAGLRLESLRLFSLEQPPGDSETRLEAVWDCPKLREVELSHASPKQPIRGRALASLRRVALGDCRTTDEFLDSLASAAELESLALRDCRGYSEADALDSVLAKGKLRGVDVSRVLAGDALIERALACRDLEVLALENCDVARVGPLANLLGLRELDLRGTAAGADDVRALRGLDLRALWLDPALGAELGDLHALFPHLDPNAGAPQIDSPEALLADLERLRA